MPQDGGETPGTSVVSPEDTTAVLTASRALLGVVARSIAPALEQVSLPQFRVLVILSSSQPMRSGDLAQTLGVHPSTFSRTADRLVAGGWVRRTENPGSRRETLIELTARGSGLVDLVTSRRAAEIARILSNLDPGDREAIRIAMQLFAGAAGEPAVADLSALGL